MPDTGRRSGNGRDPGIGTGALLARPFPGFMMQKIESKDNDVITIFLLDWVLCREITQGIEQTTEHRMLHLPWDMACRTEGSLNLLLGAGMDF
jgi:hypothetical protein